MVLKSKRGFNGNEAIVCYPVPVHFGLCAAAHDGFFGNRYNGEEDLLGTLNKVMPDIANVALDRRKKVRRGEENCIERSLKGHWKGVGRTRVIGRSSQGPSNVLSTPFQQAFRALFKGFLSPFFQAKGMF